MAEGQQQPPQVPNDNDGDVQQLPQVLDDHAQNPTGVRQCRYCREEVTGTFVATAEGLFARLMPTPIVEYTGLEYKGPLIRPCRCKGSSMYVHAECLRSWRYSQDGSGTIFYECGSCGYRYKFGRLTRGQFFHSWAIQLTATIIAMIGIVFAMGWLADPILNFWFEPEEASNVKKGYDYLQKAEESTGIPLLHHQWWILHFFKGVSSLGVLGFIQTILSASPFTWWNLRAGGLAGGRNRRERNSGTMVFVIVVGFIAFLIVGRGRKLAVLLMHLLTIIRLYSNWSELGARELSMRLVIIFLNITKMTTNKIKIRASVDSHDTTVCIAIFHSACAAKIPSPLFPSFSILDLLFIGIAHS